MAGEVMMYIWAVLIVKSLTKIQYGIAIASMVQDLTQTQFGIDMELMAQDLEPIAPGVALLPTLLLSLTKKETFMAIYQSIDLEEKEPLLILQ